LPDSYLLLLFAVGVSTLWIVVVAIREGFWWEQWYWLATNAVYMMGVAFLIWESQTGSRPDSPWIDAIVQFEWTPEITVSVLCLVVLLDFKCSSSLDHANYG
jgi:hypothetical protein